MDYDSYQKMYGGGTLATQFTLQDMQREQAKAALDAEAKQESIRSQRLANIFNEQNNPIKLQENQLGLEYTQQTQPAKIKNDLAEYAKKAKQSDLDMMYMEAQKMMGEGLRTGNKDMYEMGNKIYMTHKDMIKLREQGEQKKELVDQRTAGQIQLEAVKQPNRVALKQTIPGKAAGGGGSGGGSVTETKVLAPLLKQALDLEAAGDSEGANKILLRYQQAKQAQAAGRADPNAGKTTLSPDGSFAKTPAKAPVQFQGGGQAPAKKHSLADVQKLYPAVPPAQLKALYKQKFGVDLQ